MIDKTENIHLHFYLSNNTVTLKFGQSYGWVKTESTGHDAKLVKIC